MAWNERCERTFGKISVDGHCFGMVQLLDFTHLTMALKKSNAVFKNKLCVRLLCPTVGSCKCFKHALRRLTSCSHDIQ